MAVAERQIQVAQNGEITVGKVTDTVVDQRTGLVAQKETIAYEVPNQRGGTTVFLAERVRAARIPNWIHNSVSESNHRYQQIESGHPRSNQVGNASTGVHNTEQNGSVTVVDLFCLPFFAPCAFNLCFLLFWLCVFGIGTVILVGLTAGGPMQCRHDSFENEDVVYDIGKFTLVLLLSFLVLMMLCCCYGCCNRKPGEGNMIRNLIVYCLCTINALVFIAFLIVSSVGVFTNLSQETSNDDDDCKGLAFVPIVSLSFMYAGSLLFLCCCMCCCCMCLKTLNEK